MIQMNFVTGEISYTLYLSKSAISFIKRHEAHGNRVYVHCRAGHGRSASAVFAWLMYKDPSLDLQLLNAQLRKQRDVRKTLWKQPNILNLHSRLLEKGSVLLDGLDCQDIHGDETLKSVSLSATR